MLRSTRPWSRKRRLVTRSTCGAGRFGDRTVTVSTQTAQGTGRREVGRVQVAVAYPVALSGTVELHGRVERQDTGTRLLCRGTGRNADIQVGARVRFQHQGEWPS